MGERRYPPAVRAEVVRLARAGRRLEDLAAEFGPSRATIRYWIRQADLGGPGPAGLDATHPQLAAELDPDRHPPIDPTLLSAGSNRKVGWRCPRGHRWEATVASRVRGTGCPTCAGRHPAGIGVTHPALAAQLDPDHNPDIDPLTLTAGSMRKVWWRCPDAVRYPR